MSGMFSGASSFDQPLNDWDVSNARCMNYMFKNATSFNQNLDNWNVRIKPLPVEVFVGTSVRRRPRWCER